ncbi:thiamine phosphate synthase [Microbacterium sp. SORGH_AS_0888]|uniref:thiamine phosphate synthase n=1 Tax=Microbacterium sp. SORGH_AS_0888 TaxID=3041791 RepID=UPI0027815074|nr:thiamine phosphate synthase [Microbacterium sp. SORGH_AS_0888]MDQ1128350.1 thiamine-phosphate pyrophosphorylase [Microbacterium sp. SORGH_AS_0888]
MTIDLSLYLITDERAAASAGRGVLDTVRLAVAGGVTAVQVRAKDASARDLLALVHAVASAVPERVAVIVNDRVDVFLAARANRAAVAGVHVGQRDIPVDHVRRLVGPDAVVGLTAATPEELQDAAASPARVDYVGIGTVRETTTKLDAPAPLGIEGVIRRAATCPLPAVAIGGIVASDVAVLRAGGLAGVAVASAVGAAPDPTAAARLFVGDPA